jgi:Holliday junction resolvase RusA-like endonuclease
MPTLSFVVPGIAKPQGSKTARVYNGKAVMFEAVKGAKEWRSVVVDYAWHEAKSVGWVQPGKETPVTLSIVFQFVRPLSSKREQPTVKPDLDKLIRNVSDGLTTAQVWADDSQVTEITASKQYGDEPQVFVQVTYA